MLPYARQSIDDDDINAVIEVLRSDWLTQGPAIERFETELAAACGARHAVAVSSGTAALHLACVAAGVQPGDAVLAPTLTFVASANAAVYCGAEPVLLDIDPDTLTLDSAAVVQACRQRAVKAVIPVHFGGLPCAMESIHAAARRAGAFIIEDACHALGARWRDSGGVWRRVGDCSHSDMACFSFHPVKHITTGEGGAILTNDAETALRLRSLRSHGITRDARRLARSDGPWYYEMQTLGFNYRLTDIQCALGHAQLQKLSGWVRRRRHIAQRYRQALSPLGYLRMQNEPAGYESSCHLFVIRVPRRAEFFQKLRSRGIGVQVHYIPVHLQPFYRARFGYHAGQFPSAEEYYSRAISLPLFPAMSDADVDRVIEAVIQTAQEIGLRARSATQT